MASEWERRRRDDVVADRPGAEAGPAGDHGAPAASSADTGPLPVQRTHGARAHDLAPVHAVPPPPPHDARRHEVDGLPPRVASAGGTDRPGWMPVPRPGTGPLPVQPRYASRRDLAPVDAVPPPPPRGGSLEDELIRRAERRRRPLSSTPVAGGRHALRPLDGDEPTPHADPDRLGTGGNLLTFTGIS
ncbi:hypothetical protein [Actinomycetospora cinnamomea]|uniref:hypothetical protein n=1 Tax=Actinomycetospora cinnamomea TaxID=663609 RepID=UPI001057B7D6|nr:hypothetical protein [Actinomycetospora cinnamomea]